MRTKQKDHAGHEDVVEFLLSKGANIQAYCKKDGLTALHAAACFGHPKLVLKLIAAGAQVDSAYEPFRYTPLHVAGMLRLHQTSTSYCSPSQCSR